MEGYVEIICPNLPYGESRDDTLVDHSEVVCGRVLGGEPERLIDSICFSKIYYCRDCKMYWKVSFRPDGIPSFSRLDGKIDWIRMDDKFGLIDVDGRKIKKRKAYAS
jgi:hypothetical protein